MTKLRARGFSLIELMVVVAIIAIMLAIAVPSFGSSVRTSRERSVIQRMTQDFMWARGAAGANDASSLTSKIAVSGVPLITFVVRADCSWTVKVNGIDEPDHKMDTTMVTSIAPGAVCSSPSGLALPATFTFTPQGFVNTTGTLTFTGTSGQSFPFQILYSGAMFRTRNAS